MAVEILERADLRHRKIAVHAPYGRPDFLEKAFRITAIAADDEADAARLEIANAECLVVQARGNSSEVAVFGPMMAESVGSRINADIGRWKSGDGGCGAKA